MRRWKGRILSGVFFLFSFSVVQVAYATVAIPFTNFFTVSKHDTSVKLLAQLLGDVGGLLPSSKMQLLGFMFKDFNQAMLVLATIIIGYTVVMATIQTANEGEFLGKKFHSLWVPVRTAAGIGLVVPTTYGYSVIQIAIMWVVIQGIGLADTLWGEAVSFLQGGGGIVAPVSTVQQKAIDTSSDMFDVILCANMQENRILPDYSSKNKVIFTDTIHGKDCGEIRWSSTDQYIVSELNSTMPGVVSTFNSISYNYAQADSDHRYGVLLRGGNPILILAKTMNSAIESGVNNSSSQNAKNNSFVKMAIDYGWANAGAYYYKIAQLNNTSTDSAKIDSIVTISKGNTSLSTSVNSDASRLKKDASDALTKEEAASQGGLVNTSQMNLSTSSSQSQSGGGMGMFASIIQAPFIPIVGAFRGLFGIGSGYFANNSVDPVVKLQLIGAKITDAVITAFGAIALTAMALGAVAGICTSTQPLGVVFSATMKYLITPILAILAFIYPVGLLMAVYIPIIPYIIFTFGVIGWMIAVLESMIAGPIVALGVTHPEGQHEVYGRAEPAIQLILNLFLRPSLMIFGLMGGMILTFVTLGFVNVVYGQILSGVNWVSAPLKYFAYIMVYVYLVIAILNRCFSLIHLFPDQILRWIGNQSSFGEYAKGEEQVKAGFDKTAEAQGGALQKQSEAGIQAGGDIQKGLSDWKKEKEGEAKQAAQQAASVA